MQLVKKEKTKHSLCWRNWFLISIIILLPLMIQSLNHSSRAIEHEVSFEEPVVYNMVDSSHKGESPRAIPQSTGTLASSDHPLSAESTQLVGQDEMMIFDWAGTSGPKVCEYNGGQNEDDRDFIFNNRRLNIGKNYRSGDYPYFERDRGPFPILYSIYDRHYAFQGDQILDMQSDDIDNDGRDEIILLLMDKEPERRAGENVGSSFLRTYDDATEDYRLLDELEIFIDSYRYHDSEVYLPSYLGDSIDRLHTPGGDADSEYWFRNQDFAGAFALGDPDGDGVDSHIGIAFHQSMFHEGSLRVDLDPAEEIAFFGRWTGDNWILYEELDQNYHSDHGNKYTRRHYSVDCAWGNFDGDLSGKEEFVVASDIDCRIYNIDAVSNSAIQWKVQNAINYKWDYVNVPTGKNDYAIREEDPVDVQLATGNFDGDEGLEIVVYTNYFYYIIESTTLNVAEPNYGATKYTIKNTHGVVVHFLNISPVHLFAIDINQDGRDEIQFCGVTAASNKGYWITVWNHPTNNVYKTLHSRNLGSFWPKWSAAGDIDCDGQDEVIMNDKEDLIGVFEVGPGGELIRRNTLNMRSGIAHHGGPILCGNFNGNGLTLNYTGEFETIEYDPCVLVAMAAPPTQVGISQAYGNSYTSYGRSKTATTSETSSVEVSVNTQLSFAGDLPYWGYLAGSRVWTDVFEETGTITNTTIVTSFSTGGAQDNTIVYFQGSYKRHIYTITDHPFDNTAVGMYLNISIPDNPIIFTVTQSYFNRFYGEMSNFVPVIASETFNHTVGHPETYPNRSDILTYTPEDDIFFLSTPENERMVGQGTQYDSLVIEMSTMQEKGFTDTKSSEWGGGAGWGIGYSYSVGESESEGYSIGVGEGCVFEGRVGQIDDANEYCLFRYRWGMFIHYKTHPVTGNTYLVMNYYVDDAYPYYPSTETIATSQSDSAPFAPEFLVIAAFIVFAAVKLKKRKEKV